jgi:uncharacterized membrane protein YhhN
MSSLALTRLALALSAILAIAYGLAAAAWYGESTASPWLWAAFKASSIILLAAIAAAADARLLTSALIFGAAGDIGLALGERAFIGGAAAFMVGHLFYIALFVRAGQGVRAFTQPLRVIAMLSIAAVAIVTTSRLVPPDSTMLVALSVYTAVLTAMTMSSITLPASRWLAILGAVLFFISDGFVAANMFHPAADPTLVFWRSFTGWMLYWAGQACLCFGALGLHKSSAQAGVVLPLSGKHEQW